MPRASLVTRIVEALPRTELHAWCATLDLPASGTNAQMVARLKRRLGSDATWLLSAEGPYSRTEWRIFIEAILRADHRRDANRELASEIEALLPREEDADSDDAYLGSDGDIAREVIPIPSRWRQFVLQRDHARHHAGESTVDAMQVFERIDAGTDPEDPDFRVWTRGMFREGTWFMVPGALERGCIRLEFPLGRYGGMPPYLDLERPRIQRLAALWRLLRPDRAAIATFALTEMTEQTDRALRQLERALMRLD